MDDAAEWPELRVDDWTTTRETLHMWLQIIGKIELASTALLNHWWNVTFHVSARGLRTRLMHDGNRTFDAEFDFLDHVLVIRTADGEQQTVALKPRSVADFYAATMAALAALKLDCVIVASPNEVSPAIPFAEDTRDRDYEPQAVTTFWRQLVAVNRVLEQWRAGFAGKDSPVQLFWGSMDLSCIRYSGRVAPQWNGTPPPSCPEWVMREAESRENASAGFWAGGSSEGSFYAYAYPSPQGYDTGAVSVGGFDNDLGEWILPYDQVRTSADPAKTLLTFLDETYALAADLAHWDRSVLDVDPHRLDAQIRRGR